MRVERFVLGPLETNCYLIYDKGEAIIVDPGWHEGVELIINRVKTLGLRVKALIATHGHFDHIAGAVQAMKLLGYRVPFLIHEGDAPLLESAGAVAREWLGVSIEVPEPDRFIDENTTLKVGNEELQVIHTPGHSPGSIVLVGSRYAITGDTIFAGSVGRTDLPGASWAKLKESLRRLANMLPPATVLYPGHGPYTTLDDELAWNPFLREALNN